MKKLFRYLFCLALLMGLVMGVSVMAAATNEAPQVLAEGPCGADGGEATWVVTEDGVFAIYGSGSIVTQNAWSQYKDSVTTVLFADGILNVSSSAFNGWSELTSVHLPASLTAIDNYAFRNCGKLEGLTLPDGVTTISGYNPFDGCSARLYAELGSDTAKTLSSGNKYFYLSGYDNVKLRYTLADGEITGLTAKAHDTAITTAVIPAGVTEIEKTGFYDCDALVSVTLPEGLTAIQSTAFCDCAVLETVSLPESLTTLGTYCFADCPALTALTLPDGLTSIDGAAFSSTNARLYAAAGSDTAKTLSNGNKYFYLSGYDNVKLKYTLADGEITDLTAKAHDTAITTAVIPAGVTAIESSGFDNCGALVSVELPEGVTSLKSYAFDGCTALESVALPESLETIEHNAFRGCAALRDVTLPAGVSSIAYDAFPKSQERLTVSCGSPAMTWVLNRGYPLDTEAAADSYSYCPLHTWGESVYEWAEDNTSVTARRVCVYDASHVESETAAAASALTKSPTETAPGEHSFTSAVFDNPAFTAQVKTEADVPALGTLRGLRLPAQLTAVEEEAFRGNGSFQYVLIPAGCTAIREGAFAYCTGLQYIKIPASVTTIAADAFEGCRADLVIDRLG